MRTFIVFISTIIICSCSDTQNNQNKSGAKSDTVSVADSVHVFVNHDPYPKIVSKYDYDTLLKGGYSLVYTVDDSLQYLSLMKNTSDTMIKELNTCSLGLPQKSLGYPAVDFTDYFVLAHSFGSGNPHHIELIKKTTGQNVLKEGVIWIDANKKEEVLLYCDNDTPTQKNTMILYNVRTGQKQMFSFPSDILNEPEVYNRIQIKKLNDKQFIIAYQTETGLKTKMYSR